MNIKTCSFFALCFALLSTSNTMAMQPDNQPREAFMREWLEATLNQSKDPIDFKDSKTKPTQAICLLNKVHTLPELLHEILLSADTMQRTALHRAVIKNNTKLVLLLYVATRAHKQTWLDLLNARDDDGATALDYAQKLKRTKIVEVLTRHTSKKPTSKL